MLSRLKSVMNTKTSVTIPSETQMLNAVRQRDARADRSFVYGVISTGVYCLPSCPSRQANEDNLRFFLTIGAAEADDFRPCKRCRPAQTLVERDLMEAAARSIISRPSAASVLRQLAIDLGVSETVSRNRFTRWLGISPKALLDAARHQTLKQALKRGASVIEAINEAGFGSTRSVYERSQRLGMTPSSYRDGGALEQISFASRDTSYGTLMLAATERGVCFCQFGGSSDALRSELAAEFPEADLAESQHANHVELDAWISALRAHLDTTGPMPDVPLDLRGTIFQIRVWRFLLSLPEGATVSYADVASSISKPKAHRAVASACAANRVAVLVPCHRVLRSDGSAGGYRWGAERKQALLANERKSRGKAD